LGSKHESDETWSELDVVVEGQVVIKRTLEISVSSKW
jgi:hypothetical protein